MAQVCIEATLYNAWTALKEVVIKYFSFQVPSHHSQSTVTRLKEAKKPAKRLEFL